MGVLHGDLTVYQSADDSPKEKFRVALNYLNGDMPQEANKLLREVAMAQPDAQVAYHWTLALLSRRHLSALGDDEYAMLGTAVDLATACPADQWRSAIEVVSRLLTAASSAERADHGELAAVLQAYQALPEARRLEIWRHLGQIFVGTIQDQIEAEAAEEIRVGRMRNRENRVWKFFEPDPTAPVAKLPAPADGGIAVWVRLVGGGLLAGLGVIVGLRALTSASAVVAIVAVLMCGAGGYLAVRFGFERRYLSQRLAAKDRELASGYRSPFVRPPGEAMSDGFAATLASRVGYWFAHYEPTGDALLASRWRAETAGVQAAIQGDFNDLYGFSGCAPATIDYLIRWHVSEVSRKWYAGTLDDYRGLLRTPWTSHLGFVGGVLLGGAGALWALVSLLNGHLVAALMVVLLAGAGGRWAVRGGFELYRERRRLAADTVEFAARHSEETGAYQRWLAVLADRPSDQEMALWLDLDSAYLKTMALKDQRLTNTDVITHLVMTEAAAECRRARIIGGPMRYSAYLVMLFLITETGVRQIAVNLDFATGAFHNEKRLSFRYESIAAVRIAEVGVRYDDGRRRVTDLDEERPNLRPGEKFIASQAFQLTLVNRERIHVVVESFGAGMIDLVREDPQRLQAIAQESSGVNEALHTLESIASEGREWLGQRQRRAARRGVGAAATLEGRTPSQRGLTVKEYPVDDRFPGG